MNFNSGLRQRKVSLWKSCCGGCGENMGDFKAEWQAPIVGTFPGEFCAKACLRKLTTNVKSLLDGTHACWRASTPTNTPPPYYPCPPVQAGSLGDHVVNLSCQRRGEGSESIPVCREERSNSEMAAAIAGSLGSFSRQISRRLRHSLWRAVIIGATACWGRLGDWNTSLTAMVVEERNEGTNEMKPSRMDHEFRISGFERDGSPKLRNCGTGKVCNSIVSSAATVLRFRILLACARKRAHSCAVGSLENPQINQLNSKRMNGVIAPTLYPPAGLQISRGKISNNGVSSSWVFRNVFNTGSSKLLREYAKAPIVPPPRQRR